MHNVRKDDKQTGTNFFINFTEKDKQVTLRVGFEKLRYNWKHFHAQAIASIFRRIDYDLIYLLQFNLLITISN